MRAKRFELKKQVRGISALQATGCMGIWEWTNSWQFWWRCWVWGTKWLILVLIERQNFEIIWKESWCLWFWICLVEGNIQKPRWRCPTNNLIPESNTWERNVWEFMEQKCSRSHRSIWDNKKGGRRKETRGTKLVSVFWSWTKILHYLGFSIMYVYAHNYGACEILIMIRTERKFIIQCILSFLHEWKSDESTP